MAVFRFSAAALLAAIIVFSGHGRSALAQQRPASSPQPISPRDQSLIDSVEKAYQTGLSNYRDGPIAAARSNFDYAVDMLLRSGIDIKNDPAISEEFDRIVDAINTLELDSLREKGIQTAQQHPEDAPVDIANDVTFPVDPTVRAQA